MVLRKDPKGGDGVTAEAGTHVMVTVGGGPSAAKVPDLCVPLPKEADPMPGGQTGTPDDLVSAGRNVEQRPAAGTAAVEPDDSVGNAGESVPNRTPVSGVVGRNAEKGVIPPDHASWRGQAGQYGPQ